MKADDRAQIAAETFTRTALENAKKPQQDLANNEYCLYCHQPVHRGHAFCDIDCSKDYEFVKEREQHKRRG